MTRNDSIVGFCDLITPHEKEPAIFVIFYNFY